MRTGLVCAHAALRSASSSLTMTWGGTMTDDGAMPRSASGNSCVVGSSITIGGQSGSWLQPKMNVRRIVNQFLLSTDDRKKLAGLSPTFDSITAD